MNIFIPLLLGLLIGYVLRKKECAKKYVEYLISVSLLLLIFFLGMKTGNTRINTLYLLIVSLIFAFFATGMSVLLAYLMEKMME